MSFGSVMGAIVSLKNNKRTRTSKINKYFDTTGAKVEGVKSHTTLSAEEFKLLSHKIRKENSVRQRKVLLITAIILVLLGVFFYLVLFEANIAGF